jgi:hypothetical protein
MFGGSCGESWEGEAGVGDVALICGSADSFGDGVVAVSWGCDGSVGASDFIGAELDGCCGDDGGDGDTDG